MSDKEYNLEKELIMLSQFPNKLEEKHMSLLLNKP